jgi:PleD family two-component response regulator
MYAEIFKNSGFEVVEAGDGVEGLDKASKEAPDVIFTGIIMPRMDGFTMMEALKKTVMTASIPVVISSHMGREEDQQKANALGAKDFIVRDITRPIETVERIRALFIQEGGEYKLEFSADRMDAPKLAKDLSFNPTFNCLDCGTTISLNLKLINKKDRIFEAKFVCPKCGWEAK